MSLRSVIQGAVSVSFDVLSDLLTTAYLIKNNSNPTYDPATGSITPSTTQYEFSCLVTSYTREEVDGSSVLSTDAKIICQQSSLSATPEMKDSITIESVTWDIRKVDKDPANAIWIIQARRA